MPEAFCPEHGPYDASLGACPHPHAGGASPRPVMPTSLDDDLPTDFGRPAQATSSVDRRGLSDEEGATDIPASRRSSRGILDFDAEDPTELPRSARRGGYEDATELAEPPNVTLGMLWCKEGPRRGRFYPIKHNLVVGRKEGGLIFDDPKVSSQHAKFTFEDDSFVIWDFGSANGTFVNEKKIREATVLEENDTIKIGENIFVIKLLEPKSKKKNSTSKAKKSEAAEE